MASTEKAKEADKTWVEYLKTENVTTLEDMKKRIGELKDILGRLDQGYKDGNISLSDYSRLTTKAKDELALLTGNMDKEAIPKSREFKGIMDGMPATLEDSAVAAGGLSEDLRAFGIQAGLSYGDAITASESWRDEIQMAALRMHTTETEVVDDIIKIQTQLLILAGIKIPDPFSELPKEAKESTAKVEPVFDKLWSDIAKGFGDTFKKWMEGSLTFRDFLKGIWGDIKTAFFDFVGEMVTKWVKGFLEDVLVKQTASAAATAGTSMTSMGGAVASVATTIGTVITTLATAVATAITTIATGIGAALVSIATSVAAACTILATAAAAIVTVGIMAIALYAAFKLVGGIIDSILGGGGGGNSDITYWLKPIEAHTAVAADILQFNINGVLHDMMAGISDLRFPVQDGYNKLTDIAHYSTWLPKIYQTLLGIESNTAQGSQKGSKVTSPTWQKTGEEAPRIPEYILPEPHLMNLLQTARDAGGAGAGDGGLSVSIEGQKIDMKKGMKKLLIKLVPELSADGFLKINVKALAGER